MPHDLLSYLVRSAHTGGMALLLGGAALVWALSAWGRSPHTADPGSALRLAAAYERLFWLALGAQVMTGIGNLGALGAALPAPETTWGARLWLKLLAVLALGLFSLVRTLAIVRLGSATPVPGERASRVLPRLYFVTTVWLAAILLLAVALAHG